MTYGIWKGRKPNVTSWLSLESLEDAINPITGERLGDQDDATVAADIERRVNDITQMDETIQRTAIAADIGDQIVEVAEDHPDRMTVREIALVQAGAAATLAATGADEELIEETVAAAAVESNGQYRVSTEDLKDKLKIIKEHLIELYHKLIEMVKKFIGRLLDGYGMVVMKLKKLLAKSKDKGESDGMKPVETKMTFTAGDVYCVKDYLKPEFNLNSFTFAAATHGEVGILAKNARTAVDQMHRVVKAAMNNIISDGEDESVKYLDDKTSVHMNPHLATLAIGNKHIYLKDDEVLTIEERNQSVVENMIGREFQVSYRRDDYEAAINQLMSSAQAENKVINAEFRQWLGDAEHAQKTINDLIKQAEEKNPNSAAVSFFKKMYQTDSKVISTLVDILRIDMNAYHAQVNHLKRLSALV